MIRDYRDISGTTNVSRDKRALSNEKLSRKTFLDIESFSKQANWKQNTRLSQIVFFQWDKKNKGNDLRSGTIKYGMRSSFFFPAPCLSIADFLSDYGRKVNV